MQSLQNSFQPASKRPAIILHVFLPSLVMICTADAFLGQQRSCSEPSSRTKGCLEFPILFSRLDGPVKLLAEGLGEELLNRHVEFLREYHCKAWIDVILRGISRLNTDRRQQLTILDVPSATSLLLSLSSACRDMLTARCSSLAMLASNFSTVGLFLQPRPCRSCSPS